ncbi:restriction endonuclease [Oceanobacillus sp. CFH 90083]|uniref:restriction endonuclease n=1 Tax=Oceanobacillus sp. CFH 90083 TaxID=2592336 RepID=UPI00128CC7C3|nr:restriction endonuclease [Oceanobacillus sp. CFH 90083]
MVFSFLKKESDLKEQLNLNNQVKLDNKLLEIIKNVDECSSADFNFLIGQLLSKMGYKHQIIDGVNDKGIDIIGFKGQKKVLAVQCKAWNPKVNTGIITKQDVLAFKANVLSEEYEKGLFITSHYFSKPAIAEQEDDKIILIDRRDLYNLLPRYFSEEFGEILYNETLQSIKRTCSFCGKGKEIRLWSKNKKKYYYKCANKDCERY